MKESTVKKVINRIKGDRWGKWDDLITEMDGHSTSGILYLKKKYIVVEKRT